MVSLPTLLGFSVPAARAGSCAVGTRNDIRGQEYEFRIAVTANPVGAGHLSTHWEQKSHGGSTRSSVGLLSTLADGGSYPRDVSLADFIL